MDEKNSEKTIDIIIKAIMGVMFGLPFGLWLISSGIFGNVALVGKSDFSPWMDRLIMLSTAFWLLYWWSFVLPDLKNRAPKVFGAVALFAILSIGIIQFDRLLIPFGASNVARDAANVWFYNLPYYAMRIFDRFVAFDSMSYLVMALMGAASVGLLIWIKSEIASKWFTAIKIWIAFELTYFVAVWLMYRLFGPFMFGPKISF